MTVAFESPSFLNDQDADTIHGRMMAALPADIDNTEGGWPWNFTKPTALEKAELLGFQLVETLKQMFPMWATDEWLDYHASGRGITRKAATYASGEVTVTGTSGVEIPAGFSFASPATDSRAAIEYLTDEDSVIPVGGSVNIPITAALAGLSGNLPIGAVSIMMSPLDGISGISNAAALIGGTAEETDDELRARIDDIDSASEASFVGNDADYKRWAEDVSGVGAAIIDPEGDGPGTVVIIVVDANGLPANASLLEDVYNDIVSPDDRLLRKAPIGATVSVIAPTGVDIDYMSTVTLADGESEETVISRLTAALQEYYIEAKADGVLKYNRIAAIWAMTDGVSDFSGLLVNEDSINIDLGANEFPVTSSLVIDGGV